MFLLNKACPFKIKSKRLQQRRPAYFESGQSFGHPEKAARSARSTWVKLTKE